MALAPTWNLSFLAFSEVKGSGPRPDCGPAWEYFLSVCDNLAQGLDAEGNPLPPDGDGTVWIFCLLFGKADCEQLSHSGLPMYMDGHYICGSCWCNRTDNPWSDLRSSSRWRLLRLSNADFLSRTKGSHPLTKSHYWNKAFPRFKKNKKKDKTKLKHNTKQITNQIYKAQLETTKTNKQKQKTNKHR